MLEIFKLMAGNLGRGPVTAPFPGRVPAPDGLRGLVTLDPRRCLACGICSYVCASGAIVGSEGRQAYDWHYEPGRCTFCGRCADHCPGQALALVPEPPPSYRRRGDLAASAQVPFPPCPECGRPSRSATREWLESSLGPMDDAARERLRLCPACRRRHTQSALKAALGGVR